jgi:hypothetical protein
MKHPEAPVSDGARVFFLSVIRQKEVPGLAFNTGRVGTATQGDSASALFVCLVGKEV